MFTMILLLVHPSLLYQCLCISLGDYKSKNWFAREREIFWHVGGICSISTAHIRVQGMAPLWGRGRLAQGLWERRPVPWASGREKFEFSIFRHLCAYQLVLAGNQQYQPLKCVRRAAALWMWVWRLLCQYNS